MTGTSSLFENTASAWIGPVVTTCRFDRIMPRSASTTKPVAYENEAAKPSCERTEFTRMLTMPGVTLAMVEPQSALASPRVSICGGGRTARNPRLESDTGCTTPRDQRMQRYPTPKNTCQGAEANLSHQVDPKITNTSLIRIKPSKVSICSSGGPDRARSQFHPMHPSAHGGCNCLSVATR